MTFWLLGAFTDEYGIRQASLILTIWSTCPTELVNIVRCYGDGGQGKNITVQFRNKVEHLFAVQWGGLREEWIADHLHFSVLLQPVKQNGVTPILNIGTWPAFSQYQRACQEGIKVNCRSKCLSFGWAWVSKMQFVTSKEYLNVSHSATRNILFIIPLRKILDVWHRAQRGIKYVHT